MSGTLKLIAQEVETEQIDGAGFAWIGVPLRMKKHVFLECPEYAVEREGLWALGISASSEMAEVMGVELTSMSMSTLQT